MLSSSALKYNESLRDSRLLRAISLLPFIAMAALCVISQWAWLNIVVAGLCILAGFIFYFSLPQLKGQLFFDDLAIVRLEAAESSVAGKLMPTCYVFPFVIMLNIAIDNQPSKRLWIFSDAISDRGFRRLARIVHLNQL